VTFYVDQADQREKARRAEQALLWHSENRTPRPVAPLDDEHERSSLPPVFQKGPAGQGQWEYARETSVDKRSARFRDTHLYGPPPPPPVAPDQIPRLLPPPKFLVPQELADRGVTNDPRYAVRADPRYGPTPSPTGPPLDPQSPQEPDPNFDPLQRVYQEIPPDYEAETPRYRQTPQGLGAAFVPNPAPPRRLAYPQAIIPPEVLAQMHDGRVPLLPAYPPGPPAHREPPQDLTPSQKKRLRRKRAKEAKGSRPPSPAPFPLPQDAADMRAPAPSPLSQNGQPPIEPAHIPETRPYCGHEALAVFKHGGMEFTHRLVCPLTPWPHPNQPHLLKIPSGQDDGTEIFVGWWGRDE